jgi:glycosyltransferase involved in cell wall biosynthesis
MKKYDELPAYLATWDTAMMPFAINDATRFISPTKTPEYLAAGKPVVSTPINDVIRPYGDMGIVHIAADVPAFVEAIAHTLGNGVSEREKADRYLAEMSWDKTWQRMNALIEQSLAERSSGEARRPPAAA